MYFAVDQLKANKESWSLTIEDYERNREEKGNENI
jgi:hypothetical protein